MSVLIVLHLFIFTNQVPTTCLGCTKDEVRFLWGVHTPPATSLSLSLELRNLTCISNLQCQYKNLALRPWGAKHHKTWQNTLTQHTTAFYHFKYHMLTILNHACHQSQLPRPDKSVEVRLRWGIMATQWVSDLEKYLLTEQKQMKQIQ